VTRFKAPRQSETTLTLPERSPCTLFMLSKIKWMAIRPSSSPLYAFATFSASKNDPINQPRHFVHSSTNAAEQRFGYSLRVYKPSVTATRVPSWIALCSQLNPPAIEILSHNMCCPMTATPPGTSVIWEVGLLPMPRMLAAIHRRHVLV
jgi:hypothetical protein